jgi:group I intron endonuclease
MNTIPNKIKKHLEYVSLPTRNISPFFMHSEMNQDHTLLNKRIAGIYVLVGDFDSDFVDCPIYIGGSNNAPGRIKNHFIHLKRNKHKNQVLQRAFNKENGKFHAFLIEECPVEQVVEREQYYLDLIRPFLSEGRGYNMEKKAKRNVNPRCKPCPEESKRKIGEKNSRPFKVIDPQGNLVEGPNLTEYCRQNKLNPPLLCAVIRGRRKNHKGYTSVDRPDLTEKIKKLGNLSFTYFELISPTGELFTGVNLRKFCREHGLVYSHIDQMVNGHRNARKHYKRWTVNKNK